MWQRRILKWANCKHFILCCVQGQITSVYKVIRATLFGPGSTWPADLAFSHKSSQEEPFFFAQTLCASPPTGPAHQPIQMNEGAAGFHAVLLSVWTWPLNRIKKKTDPINIHINILCNCSFPTCKKQQKSPVQQLFSWRLHIHPHWVMSLCYETSDTTDRVIMESWADSRGPGLPSFTFAQLRSSLNSTSSTPEPRRVRLRRAERVWQVVGFAFVDAACRLGCWLFSLNGKSQLSAGKKEALLPRRFLSFLSWISGSDPSRKPLCILWLEPVIRWYFKAAQTWPSVPPDD